MSEALRAGAMMSAESRGPRESKTKSANGPKAKENGWTDKSGKRRPGGK